ncbi:MAG: LptF/LptG family permease [Opitutales bacterium]
MSLLSRYLLKEWSVGFALTMGVILGVLLLQSMLDSLPDLLAANASLAQIGFFFALSLPTYLPAILPIAFLVSLLFALGNLHRNYEIIAMRAAGQSLLQISRPLWGVGLLFSALLLYLTASVVPNAVERSRTFYENLDYASREARLDARQVGLIYNLGFDNREEGRLWMMNRFSERAWLAMGVTVHLRTAAGRELQRISASEAYFDDTQGYWVFVNGRELSFDPESGDPLRTQSFREKAFTEFTEDPSLMLGLHKKPRELSLNELRRIIQAVPPEENPAAMAYLTRYFSLLASPFSCLVIVGIAVPFAVSGVRANPMVGISKCIGYFVLFYVLISCATILGEREVLPAWLAAWLPNLSMLGIAVWLFRSAR